MSKRLKPIPSKYISWSISLPPPLPITSDSVFHNKNPLHIEIGAGSGHFIFEMARVYPNINFIAVEILRRRFVKALLKGAKANLLNVKYIHGDAIEIFRNYIPSESVSHIYLNFPEPWPKKRHKWFRLVNPIYFQYYDAALKVGGAFTIVSDNLDYLRFAKAVFDTWGGYTPIWSIESLDKIDMWYPASMYEIRWREEGREIYILRYVKNERIII